jgi:MFS family permease
MRKHNIAANVPIFYVYTLLNNFILDRAIWMLFLLAKGFSLSQIALIESAYHAMNFVFEVPTGYVADRYGKRASLLLGQLVAVVSSAMLAWNGHGAWLVVGFMLGALVGTFQSGATSSLIYETLKQLGREERFTRYNSQVHALTMVALGISGIAGGWLSDVNWAWVYWGKVLTSLICLVVVLFLTEPHTEVPPVGSQAGGARYSFLKQLRIAYTFASSNRSFLSLSVFGAVLYSMSWSIAFYCQAVFQELGLPNKAIGLLNGLETWVSVAVAGIAYLGERRLGKKGSLLLAGAGYMLVLILFAASTVTIQAITAFFLMAGFISYLEPILEAYQHDQLPSPIRATMLSVFSMMISVGMMITYTAIGFLADRLNLSHALQTVLLIWVPLCATALGWALKGIRQRRLPDDHLI